MLDAASAPVGRGRVFLVPAAQVAALREVPFDLTLPPHEVASAAWDEPLEDIIARAPSDLLSAPVQADGVYRFAQIPEGAFFPVFMPAEDDRHHLPGGDRARTPRSAEALRGARLDLHVSSSPTPAAHYVGSTACLTCHGRHRSLAGAHALSLRVPGRDGPLQDSAELPRIEEALRAFEQGKTLYFYDCAQGAAEGRTCSVREEPPVDLSRVGFVARLVRDPAVAEGQVGAYVVELSLSTADAGQRYPVVLTIGGVLSYQQFVTRVALPDGGYTHWVLPFSYQLAGSDDRTSPRDYRWVAYRAEDWLDIAEGALREPDAAESFDRQCAGCHVTGMALRGDEARGFRASAAPSVDGVFDLDGDGRRELLGVACEACHGPGSEHIERTPRGQFIVSPSKLTPERQAMLCGSCHSDPRGRAGEHAPLSEQGRMPRPGMGRREVAEAHVSRMDADEAALFPSGDSRLSHQQYTDFVRSPKYRNENLLVTCTDCHDPHAASTQTASSSLEPAQDRGACVTCHREPSDLYAHAEDMVDYDHRAGLTQGELSCARCHMAKTAAGGARIPGLTDLTPLSSPVHYLQGDRASHRFSFTGREHAAVQPVAATDGCAFCHGEFLANP